MYAACFLAFCTGFLSLSLEILWVRLFSFASHSMPQAFAFVLAMYLIGIALGAYLGKKFCKKKMTNLWLVCGIALLFSSLCDLIGPWFYTEWALTEYRLLAAGLIIILTALLKAIAFPIAHHLGTPAVVGNVGRNISRVYVSNIIGATLGPIFTGILLLALVTTQQGFIICAALTFLTAIFCLIYAVNPFILSVGTLSMACVFGFLMTINSHQLIAKVAVPIYGKIINVLENPHGIITVYEGGREGDIVVGGNVYDGRTNLNPVINSNRINRVIILSALVDKPAHVLMIGLSVGSWLKIVTTFPGVENIDVVEINPGYLKLIQNYTAQESAILDPRVHVYIADGRRWLKAHPNNKYDMIIMNTTYYWRAYCTNLLSQEFLKQLKHHMNPGAVLEFNTTGSPHVLKTASSVFKHAYLYENFVVAGDFDWRQKLRSAAAVDKLSSLTLDGLPLYPPGSQHLIAGYLNLRLTPLEEIEPIYDGLGRRLEIITDNNLITEFKYGKTL